MRAYLRLGQAAAPLLMLPTGQAQAECQNLASTCTQARATCYRNVAKASDGTNPSVCEGWWSRCMRTGEWKTPFCDRKGLKRV